jgi:hypothetical protein
VVEVHTRGVELVPEVRAPGTGADLVVGPEHDVVGEQLRAPVEELGEGLLPVLGVELVLLLDRNPRKLTALLDHLLAELGVLGLELRELVASRLPVLTGSNLVVGHGSLLCRIAVSRRSHVTTGASRRTHRRVTRRISGRARGRP